MARFFSIGSGLQTVFAGQVDTSTPSITLPQDEWVTKADMAYAREALAAFAIGGKGYAVGGVNGGTYYRVAEEYDPETDTWSHKANMPTGRGYLAAFAIGGKGYAVGGNSGGSYLATNEEYDPETDTWTPKADMPTARYGLAAFTMGGKGYAVGGYNGSYLATNEEYDPETDTWTPKADMSAARYGLAAFTMGGKGYAVGSNTVNEEYDPESDTWAFRELLPAARIRAAAFSIDYCGYVVGGRYGADVFTGTVAYPTGWYFYSLGLAFDDEWALCEELSSQGGDYWRPAGGTELLTVGQGKKITGDVEVRSSELGGVVTATFKRG